MIIPVYKPLGVTTHPLAIRMAEIESNYLQEAKVTHTGSLDPMAEGVVIMLTREDRFFKSDFATDKKTYQFEILWGAETDSLDLLGYVRDFSEFAGLEDKDEEQVGILHRDQKNLQKWSESEELPFKKQLQEILPQFVGKYEQKLPKFSARRIDGKSYFDLANEGVDFEPASDEVEVFDLKIIGHDRIKRRFVAGKIHKRLRKVVEGFAKMKKCDQWVKFFKECYQSEIVYWHITKFEVVSSRRTYVRALMRDIAQKLGVKATTYSILRTQNGKYGVKDCICLI